MLIIDAFNVLHTQGVLPPDLADPGVPGLIRLIGTSRYAGRDLTVVCDGGNATTDSGVRMDHAMVLYAGAGREADDVIEDLIERYHKGNPLEVVSSDTRLRRAARRKRAGSIPSDRFLTHLVEDTRRPRSTKGHAMRAQVPLDRYTVNAWLAEFGIPHASSDPLPREPADRREPRELAQPGPRPAARPSKRRAPTTSLGSRLDLAVPRPPRPTPEAPDTPEPPRPPPRSATPEPRAAEPPRSEAPLDDLDPLLIAALQEWRDRLTVDDLDMQRWAPDATPLDPDRRR